MRWHDSCYSVHLLHLHIVLFRYTDQAAVSAHDGTRYSPCARPCRAVKQQLREKEAGTAQGPNIAPLPLVSEALELAESIKDVKVQRALMRLQARALRQSGEICGCNSFPGAGICCCGFALLPCSGVLR